jgi:diaminohydroxyphosphoribosylaminopyrimidine deaminase/5-amino-6-(5-phosphoribosylamino)uracil reductase
MEMDEFYMQRCIDLARIGEGNVAPNPMVGAVIVYDGKLIGEGFHQKYGEAHAEVNAVNSVVDKSLLSKSTIYVSLEPCAHFGKTPPCADLIVKSNFKRVVIGCFDSYAEVSGNGIQKIKNAGIECEIGVLENECKELNKRFFTFHDKKRPYVILKWAQTKDGFFDVIRDDSEKGANWISSPETKVLVHKWRSVEQSILVGKNTVLIDNPTLTVREISGKNPTRIVLDSHLSICETANVFNLESKTIILNLQKNGKQGNVEWIKISNMKVETILNCLYNANIQSVFIEGGVSTHQSFIESNCWDEARVIVGESIFNEGLKAPVLSVIPSSSFSFSSDLIYIYSNI